MNYNHLHYQTGLNLLYGVGPRKAKELIKRLDSIEKLFHENPSFLAQKTGFSTAFFEKMNRDKALRSSLEIVRFHEEKGIKSHFFQDASYPTRLRHCQDGPLILYSLGNVSLNDHHFVAVVGTRDCTSYGQQICKSLISSFKEKNIVVVSGLAYGIDTMAHRYALDNRIPTIAVLGHGLDRIYPYRNRQLAKEIIRNGALVTEFPPETNPDRENFPKRNRIVAGLCDATIVVESKTTGGSLITAYFANDYNRDVFAYPGSIYRSSSEGCNMIIRNHQAQLLDSPESFLNQMGWASDRISSSSVQRKAFPNLTPTQIEILDAIEKAREIQVDVLALHLRKNVSEINAALLLLEIEGAVQSISGNRYIIP